MAPTGTVPVALSLRKTPSSTRKPWARGGGRPGTPWQAPSPLCHVTLPAGPVGGEPEVPPTLSIPVTPGCPRPSHCREATRPPQSSLLNVRARVGSAGPLLGAGGTGRAASARAPQSSLTLVNVFPLPCERVWFALAPQAPRWSDAGLGLRPERVRLRWGSSDYLSNVEHRVV